MEPDPDFDLLAAALRADMSDVAVWVPVLCTKLAGALPMRVALRRGGFLGNGPVIGMQAELGTYRYALRLEHGHPVAERTHVVRGIALKTEPMPLDGWLMALTEELAQIAAASAQERAAIQRLLH